MLSQSKRDDIVRRPGPLLPVIKVKSWSRHICPHDRNKWMTMHGLAYVS